MSTKINVKRPGTGLVKLEVTHNGTGAIRSNLSSSLFGTTSESRKYIVEVRELAASVSHPCLTVPEDPPVFFRVFGKEYDRPVRNADGTFNSDGFFLGNRANFPEYATNGSVEGMPEAEFEMRVPIVYSLRDLIWKIQKKINRINDVLLAFGWTDDLSVDANAVTGLLSGGWDNGAFQNLPGSTTPNIIILPTNPLEGIIDDEKMQETLIELHFDASGYLAFQGSPRFWDSFGIWCSPYFRQLTGFDELIVMSNDVFGEAESTDDGTNRPAGQWKEAHNTQKMFISSPKNLYNTFEERQSILLSSDIPLPPERNMVNGDDQLRYIFGHFDLKGIHDHVGGRRVINGALDNDWYLEGTNIVGMQLMDSPKETGFASIVLPTILPSINVRALLRRKVWDFETNSYSVQEVPLLQSDIDQLLLRLNFTLQM